MMCLLVKLLVVKWWADHKFQICFKITIQIYILPPFFKLLLKTSQTLSEIWFLCTTLHHIRQRQQMKIRIKLISKIGLFVSWKLVEHSQEEFTFNVILNAVQSISYKEIQHFIKPIDEWLLVSMHGAYISHCSGHPFIPCD